MCVCVCVCVYVCVHTRNHLHPLKNVHFYLIEASQSVFKVRCADITVSPAYVYTSLLIVIYCARFVFRQKNGRQRDRADQSHSKHSSHQQDVSRQTDRHTDKQTDTHTLCTAMLMHRKKTLAEALKKKKHIFPLVNKNSFKLILWHLN